MLDILSVISGKKKHTSSGWYSFNAVCCHHRGHKPDRRSRAGIKFADEINWNYHCFNCQFKCGFTIGKQFSNNLKLLLQWSGLEEDEINKLSFESFSQRNIYDLQKARTVAKVIDFKTVNLPDGSRPVTSDDTLHVDYLASRGLTIDDYKFHVVDNESRTRIIIPYYYKGQIVGNTSRFYDNRKPKYLSEQQTGYVFNIDSQRSEWEMCILVEGQFDAISVGGCAYMGSNISDDQAILLSRLHRTIIVVPDRDKAGMSICDRALELGYKVSIPSWHDDVKDVNDAVVKYGKLPTLLSIIESATSSKIKIEMSRKKFK